MDLETHPEDILDRALLGKLSEGEQHVLDRHLAVCRACVAHLTMVRAAQAASVPQPWDGQSNIRAVEYALQGFGRWHWPAFFRRQRRLSIAAGILLVLGGMASAARWYTRDRDRETISSRQLPGTQPGGSAPRRLVTVQREAPISLSVAAGPSGERPNGFRATPEQPSAAVLFGQASALRARNRPTEAIATFQRLQRLFPRSRESRISFAVTGRMLLDSGHPGQALAQFDQHLAQEGEASEEALVGRATALQQMGRLSAERDSWARLLAVYPKSVYADQARERLSQIPRLQGAFPSSGPSF